MKVKALLIILPILTLILAACSPAATEVVPSVNGQPTTGTSSALTRTDAQGAVTVTVTPLSLSPTAETLDFDIELETHSVDLSMDLATLATLATDTGKTVQALKWDAPRGGHHVSGKLSFPAKVNGSALLDGAKRLTLIIKSVDAPERVFVWELGS